MCSNVGGKGALTNNSYRIVCSIVGEALGRNEFHADRRFNSCKS